MATAATVRSLALTLPETSERPSYGTPGFRVRNRLFARLRDDDTVLMVCCDFFERDALLARDPATFFVTPHYDGYPAVLVRLERIEPDELEAVLIEAWRFRAPKRLAATHDAAQRQRTRGDGTLR